MTPVPLMLLALFLIGASDDAQAASPSPTTQPPRKPMTFQQFLDHPEWFGESVPGLAWAPDGRSVSWLEPPPGKGGAAPDLMSVDLKGKKKRLLVGESLTVPGPDGKSERLPLGSYRWTPRGDALLVIHRSDLYLISLPSARITRLTTSPDLAKRRLTFSPDGARLVFTSGADLWLLELASREVTRLTYPQPEGVLQGDLDWMYAEELLGGGDVAFAFSPDGEAIAWLTLDVREVPTWPLVALTADPPALTSQRYSRPGDPLPRAAVKISDLTGKVLAESAWETEGYIPPILAWTADSQAVAVPRLNRRQEELRFELLPRDGGAARPWLVEKGQPWVNLLSTPVFSKDGRFVWVSERDGFVRPYRGDVAHPEELRPMAAEPWDLRPLAMSTDGSWLWFTGSGGALGEQHLWRMARSGGELVRMTFSPGWHEALVAPRGEAFVDTFSSLSSPPVVNLWEGRMSKVVALRPVQAELLSHDMGSAETVDLRAADGTGLRGILFRPAGFDPGRRWPAVVVTYGGPHFQMCKNRFPFGGFIAPLLARGYVVWIMDNRGSSDRGLAFEAHLDQRLGQVELADQLVGVDYLRSLPFIDPERIGLLGKSYGGYMTLYALTHSDVFKVGVSMAPVSDWRRYDAAYTERYLHTPAENPEGYAASGVVGSAAQLKAPLLLVHGGVDDNVHLDHVAVMLQALAMEGKIAPLLLFPEADHGVNRMSGPPREALLKATVEFLDLHLRPEVGAGPAAPATGP